MMLDHPAITFEAGLPSDTVEMLRPRLLAWSAGRSTPVHVDTLVGCVARNAHGERFPAGSVLLLDVHSLILYDPPLAGDDPGLESVVRFIVDAHPVNPFDSLLRHASTSACPPLYGSDTLDVVLARWSDYQPGIVRMADLITAELTSVDAQEHPERLRRTGSERPTVLRDVWVDESLRSVRPLQFEDLVSASTGVIRACLDRVDDSSLPCIVASGIGPGQLTHTCFGKSLRPSAARMIAACEALERFQVSFRSSEVPLEYGSYRELAGRALDPETLFFQTIGPLPKGLVPYDPDTRIHWTSVADPRDGATALVPAQEIWFNTDRLPNEPRLVRSTTSGAALGTSVEEAATFALLEAIERDAFLIVWYLRARCPKIDLDSVEYEPFQLLRRRWEHRFPAVRLCLVDVTADTAVPTVMLAAVAPEGSLPRVRVAAAARLTVERAAFAALKDLTDAPATVLPERLDDAYRLLEDPSRVRSPEDHYFLYCLDETFTRLAFLELDAPPDIAAAEVNRRAIVPRCERYNLRELLLQLIAHIRSVGGAVFLKDITHRSLEGRGVSCVRAITPGLYPMWFGEPRFAVTERLRRRAAALGVGPVDTAADCNLQSHPFP